MSYIRMLSNFPILVKTPLIFPIPWAPAPFPKRGVRALEILYDKNLKGCVYKRLQISDLSGLKKMKRLFSYSFYAIFQLQFTI